LTDRTLALARITLKTAGSLLLLETALGSAYVIGIGFSTTKAVILDLCLTMAFPVFLISLLSVRRAAVGLWIFFAIQWIDICCAKWPPVLVNPLGWTHGILLFAGAILVSMSAWILMSSRDGKGPAKLLDVLNTAKTSHPAPNLSSN
jgi:hypothetical protein